MNGILPINKPVGISSFDVIREFKRAVHPDFKIGHGGTLDPFASGVLLLLLGKATKKMNELSALPKTYRAVGVLGSSSDTLDSTGVVNKGNLAATPITTEEIKRAALNFVGTIEQEIPDYSATKINGVPRYKLARQGTVMEKKSKPVTIHELQIETVDGDEVTFVTRVSSGTYIRQLSFDLFNSLGVPSYLRELTRTEIGEFTIQKCGKIEDFKLNTWQDKVIPLTQQSPDE